MVVVVCADFGVGLLGPVSDGIDKAAVALVGLRPPAGRGLRVLKGGPVPARETA